MKDHRFDDLSLVGINERLSFPHDEIFNEWQPDFSWTERQEYPPSREKKRGGKKKETKTAENHWARPSNVYSGIHNKCAVTHIRRIMGRILSFIGQNSIKALRYEVFWLKSTRSIMYLLLIIKAAIMIFTLNTLSTQRLVPPHSLHNEISLS